MRPTLASEAMEAFIPLIINQLALTDYVEGLWSLENRYQSSAKAFLHDQDPFGKLLGRPNYTLGSRGSPCAPNNFW
jgi:hypothetical protein